jgi:uncharacterized delta-60 repeat protein
MHRRHHLPTAFALLVTALLTLPLAAQTTVTMQFTRSTLTVLEPDGVALVPLARSGSGTESFARLDLTPGSATTADYVAAPGRIDPAFGDAQLNATVRALAVQRDGKIVLGGAFTTLGGQPRNRLARLNPDGTPDPAFSASADGPVAAIAIQDDGAIVIGGFFSTVNGQPRARLARLNPDGSLDAAFNPGLSLGSEAFPNGVLALTVQSDGAILVGGEFSSIAGAPQANLARLTPAGAHDPAFNPIVNGPVYAILLRDEATARRMLIGGNFTQVNSQTRRNLVGLTNDGGLDSGFNPFVNPDGPVYGLAHQADANVLAVGFFSAVFPPTVGTATPRPGLVRLEADGNLDPTFNLGGTTSGVINRVAVQPDGKVLIAGQFTNTNLPDQANLARLNADGTPDPGFAAGLGPDGPVDDLVLRDDGAILIGGFFNRYNLENTAPDMLARVQGDLFVRWGAAEPAGTEKVARLPIVADDLAEGVEEVTVTLTPFGGAAGDPATLTLRIRDTNTAPTALPLNVRSYRLGDVRITLIGSDADEDPLSYTIVQLPARGALYQYAASGRGTAITAPNTPVSDPEGRVIFAPESDEPGTPYADFTYRTTDGFAVSAPATVTVNIEPVFRVYVPLAR